MMKLLYGKPHNENNIKIFDKALKYIETNKSEKICYIAPTYQMIKDLKDELYQNSEVIVTGETNFLLFKGLINEVLKESTKFKPIINDVQKELILKKITTSLIEADEIKYFKKIAQYPGFYEDLLNLIQEISMENEIEDSSSFENINNQKFKEVFKIYNRYYDYLQQNDLNDERLQYKAALGNLSDSDMIKNIDLFIIDGFQYLNLYQKRLLNQLSKLDKEIWINLNYEEDRTGIYNQKEELTKDLNIDNYINGKSLSLNNDDLKHIRNNLFSIDYKKRDADDLLQIISAEDEETEIRYIARKIKDLIINKDVSPEQIGLVVKSQVRYFDLIDEIFEEYKIPYYTSNSTTFKQTGLWILINQIFELIRSNYERSTVLKLLKSNFTDIDLAKEDIERLQLKIWDDGIIKGKDLDYILKDNNSDYPPELKEKIKLLIDFYQDINKANKFVDYSNYIKELLNKFNTIDCITNFSEEEMIIQELKAYDVLDSQLTEYGEIIEHNIDFEDYIYWFKKIFKEQMIENNQLDNISRVKVLTPSQARSKKFDYIFIPGLLEGEFPAVNYNRWLIKDKERKILENMGLDIKTKNDLLITENYLFYRNLLNANKKVYLTYPTLGEGEGGEIISSFVDEVSNLFTEGTINKTTINSYELKIENIKEAFSIQELKKHIVKNIDPKQLNNLIAAYEVEELRNSKHYTNADGLIDAEDVLTDLKNHFNSYYSYSPSSLERYMQCPFRFFVEKVLKLEEIEEPEDRLKAIQIGDLYHKILFKYFSSKFPGHWRDDLDEYLDKMEQAAKEVFADYQDKRSLVKGVWSIYKEEIINNLKLLIKNEYNNDYQTVPYKLEFGFGIPKDYQDSKDNIEEPIEVGLLNETIKLKGKIDRIDRRRNQEELMIYDYKLSDKKGNTGDFFDFNELQIPLYILALGKIMPDKTLMGGAYYSLLKLSQKGIWKKDFVEFSPRTNLSKTVMDQAEWDKYFEDLKEKIEEILAGIKNGDFRLDPKECEYCAGKEICRYNKARVGDIID